MAKRWCAGIVAAAAVVAAVQAGAPVGEQAGSRSPWPSPRTPWGDPDLQGLWTYEVEIPLQRPARYGDRESLTEDERAALDKERATILGRTADGVRRYAHGHERAAEPRVRAHQLLLRAQRAPPLRVLGRSPLHRRDPLR